VCAVCCACVTAIFYHLISHSNVSHPRHQKDVQRKDHGDRTQSPDSAPAAKSACGLHFTSLHSTRRLDDPALSFFISLTTPPTSRIAEICICRKVQHSCRKTEHGRGDGDGGPGRGAKARQLHPDPAIRPSVKRAETIEKDKRDI